MRRPRTVRIGGGMLTHELMPGFVVERGKAIANFLAAQKGNHVCGVGSQRARSLRLPLSKGSPPASAEEDGA